MRLCGLRPSPVKSIANTTVGEPKDQYVFRGIILSRRIISFQDINDDISVPIVAENYICDYFITALI